MVVVVEEVVVVVMIVASFLLVNFTCFFNLVGVVVWVEPCSIGGKFLPEESTSTSSLGWLESNTLINYCPRG